MVIDLGGEAPYGLARRTSVAEIMTRHVVTVPVDLPMEELEALLRFGISGVPVVDADGQLVGMVSKTDLVWEHHTHPAGGDPDNPAAWSQALEGALQTRGERRPTVEDLMSATVVSLPQTASVAHAAALMAHEGVHRLPIVSPSGRVVGQVSSLDVLRWLGHVERFVLPRSDD